MILRQADQAVVRFGDGLKFAATQCRGDVAAISMGE